MKLTVENISKKYSSKTVLDDVSFEMESGITLGLLGPNGAGKTTLFYIIAGLLKKGSGSIKLDSKDVSAMDISERSSLGLSYLPQEASIFKKLTVKENILAALEQRNDLNLDSIKRIMDRKDNNPPGAREVYQKKLNCLKYSLVKA